MSRASAKDSCAAARPNIWRWACATTVSTSAAWCVWPSNSYDLLYLYPDYPIVDLLDELRSQMA